MLSRLMMLPCPRAAIPGAERGDQLVRRPNVAGEQLVERVQVEISARPEPGQAGVVHQHIDRAGFDGQPIYILRDRQIGP